MKTPTVLQFLKRNPGLKSSDLISTNVLLAQCHDWSGRRKGGYFTRYDYRVYGTKFNSPDLFFSCQLQKLNPR